MGSANSTFPELFSDLEPLADWVLHSERARYAKRSEASREELLAFYNLMAPRIEAAITYLEGFALDTLLEQEQRLLVLTFSMGEVAAAVEKYDCKERYAFDLDRMIPIHDF